MERGLAIRVRGLVAGYGREVILQGIDFDVPRGRVFVILGGSGCGKTTLLQHLIGLLDPIAGTIDIDERGAPDLTRGLPGFGVSFQSGALFGSMTLLENVALPLRRWSGLPLPAIDELAAARLRLVGLAGYEHHLPSAVSGGMQKRAGIARALAMEPSMLFLDEPGRERVGRQAR